jgi:hypothetical protein
VCVDPKRWPVNHSKPLSVRPLQRGQSPSSALLSSSESQSAQRGGLLRSSGPLVPDGSWTETVLHAFSGGDDGGLPRAGPTIGGSGVLYGSTTAYGPVGKYGTVFALMP